MSISKRQINRALKKAGLEMTIEGNQWDGYYYFVDLDGEQVGGSVSVCYLNHQSVQGWVNDAFYAKGQQDLEDIGKYYDKEVVTKS